VRIELTTYPLPRGCATTTLLRQLKLAPKGPRDRCYNPSVRRAKERWKG